MSIDQKIFLQWFAGICGTLLVAMVISVFSVLSSIDVMAEKINQNANNIIRIEGIHEDDMDKMNIEHRADMNDLKRGQQMILKKLLEQ